MTGQTLHICNPNSATETLYPVVRKIVEEIIIPTASKRDSMRTGGWFTFWRRDQREGIVIPVVGFAVGVVSAERLLRYQHFANEKAHRLSGRPADISSWQSRNENKRMYGGAIRCGGIYFSFSGFSGLEDEMICAIAARRLGLLNDQMFTQIVQASNNTAVPQELWW